MSRLIDCVGQTDRQTGRQASIPGAVNQVDVATDSFCSPDVAIAGADLAMAVGGSAAVRA